MQPHSMAALAVNAYVWNQLTPIFPSKAQVDIEYTNKEGRWKKNVYEVTVNQFSDDQKKSQLSVIRGGGGLACVVEASRSSTYEGAKITQTHQTQHVAGLREEYELWKNAVRQGRHFNSLVYGNFSGEISKSDPRKMRFTSEIRNDYGSIIPLSYEITITSIH